MKEEFKFIEGMGEISGFGGGYEDVCRKMLLNGLKWLKTHPEADPIYIGFKDIYGIRMTDNDDAKELDDAIMEGIDDATGAMHQAVVSHIIYIISNGWDKYVKKMKKRG